MALTKTGILSRDIRLNAQGVPSGDGRLYLRGERVTVHRDYADELFAAEPARGTRRLRANAVDTQAIPAVTK